jgi:hypothetical protein
MVDKTTGRVTTAIRTDTGKLLDKGHFAKIKHPTKTTGQIASIGTKYIWLYTTAPHTDGDMLRQDMKRVDIEQITSVQEMPVL